MTQALESHAKKDDREEGLNWARIAGITSAIAVHVAALLVLLAPMAPAADKQAEEHVTFVNLIKPPPPPPPPPPPKAIQPLTPPKTIELPPPPDDPPILVDDPSPVDLPPPPPAPPAPTLAPPAPQIDTFGTVDPSSRSMNPPKYPPSEARQGIGGTVVLIISIDGQGNVLDVSVEKSSRNRNLDRAASDAARKWRFTPAMAGGQGVPSRVRVPVDFVPET